VKNLKSEISNSESSAPHPALGIDHGDARIGLAATDAFGILAHPVETVDNTHGEDRALTRIAAVAAMRGIRTLVVGLPIRLDGTEGTAAAKVRAFTVRLREKIPAIPLVFVDECLTTAAATEKLRQAGRKTRDHRKIIDQAAAVEILNNWMGNSD
jgi:putative Holliday junction resolvase